MQDELARIVAGLPVASLWPLAVPHLARSRFRTTTAATVSAAYVLAPEFPDVGSLVLLALAALAAFAFSDSATEEERAIPSGATWQPIVGLLLAAIAACAVGFDQARSAVEHAIESNDAALVVTGVFACVFLGGSFVAWVLSPFTSKLDEEDEPRSTLEDAGRYIGWFERAVLFAFVMGGAPEAAAIALAAKSFARFPTFREHQEGFAEYFLIGSLASIAVAVAVAAATRGALGIGSF
jgi:uncharacterized membrane protein